MNVLIIEDEPAAARHLQALIQNLPFDVNIVGILETVRSAAEWLNAHPPPELIVSDIQLADGISFQIFKAVPVTAPIIFTTAYDEYMQRAFKTYGIDYLLKPIDPAELETAFKKYSALQHHYQRQISGQLLQILDSAILPSAVYKLRFLVKTGDRLSTIPVDDVFVLRATDRMVILHGKDRRKFILDDSLDNLERVLNPMSFFRLNRRYIVPVASIDRIQSHFNGKLHVHLKAWDDQEIFVSREKVKHFKQWLDGTYDRPGR